MFRLSRKTLFDLFLPPVQFPVCDRGVTAFVDNIIDLATEGVQRGYGTPLFHRQEQKAVVEAGAASGRFLLAVLVGRHGSRNAMIGP